MYTFFYLDLHDNKEQACTSNIRCYSGAPYVKCISRAPWVNGLGLKTITPRKLGYDITLQESNHLSLQTLRKEVGSIEVTQIGELKTTIIS